MKIGAILRSACSVVVLTLVVVSEASASCTAFCVMVKLDANVQLSNLHPQVTHLQVMCASQVSGADNGWSAPIPVVNRGYSGTVTTFLKIPVDFLAAVPGHTADMTCGLFLMTSPSNGQMAHPTASQPELMTGTNWNVVSAGSKIMWTQTVAFPNSAAP